MILYGDGFFGIHTLFRVYGSAAYKSLLFSAWSSVVYALLYYYQDGVKRYGLLDHPYPVAVIITGFIFVLSSKVNFCYNRFWEACTSLHHMHVKWQDAGSTLAAFHMQSSAYDRIRPPSYADQPQDCTVGNDSDPNISPGETWDTEGMDDESKGLTIETGVSDPVKDSTSKNGGFLRKRGGKGIRKILPTISINASTPRQLLRFPEYRTRPSKNKPALTERTSESSTTSISKAQGKDTNPSLFLQEAAHLVSLLSAVALSTLRCDSDDADAPLAEFQPGHKWPNYNSDHDPDMQKYGYNTSLFITKINYMFDVSRTRNERNAYNAARPFHVIGGVSEREALLLQSARGASAKTGLVFTWLTEFLIREQIHGSLGNVAPPIVSRIPQLISDGHMWYNSARKMAYIPFPFAHTQMATMFTIVSVFLIPTLMLSKTAAWFGFVLNFLTVLLFTGLNEISKELEYPFRSMPNDIPLNLFQAQFNEALITMFSGFHPDLLHARNNVEHA